MKITQSEAEQIIITWHVYNNVTRFTCSEAMREINVRSHCEDVSISRAALILRKMVNDGKLFYDVNAGRRGVTLYSKSTSKAWTAHKWGRKHTNAQLGVDQGALPYGLPASRAGVISVITWKPRAGAGY